MTLTPRQEAYKNNLLEGMNQQSAYIAAGYSANPNTAKVNAARLLTNANFRAEYNKAKDKAAKKAEVCKADVLKRLWLEARGGGDDTASSARVSALDKLAKHFGIYEVDNAQKVPKIETIKINLVRPDGTTQTVDE